MTWALPTISISKMVTQKYSTSFHWPSSLRLQHIPSLTDTAVLSTYTYASLLVCVVRLEINVLRLFGPDYSVLKNPVPMNNSDDD